MHAALGMIIKSINQQVSSDFNQKHPEKDFK